MPASDSLRIPEPIRAPSKASAGGESHPETPPPTGTDWLHGPDVWPARLRTTERQSWRSRAAFWGRQALTRWEHHGLPSLLAGVGRTLWRRWRQPTISYPQWISAQEPDRAALDRQRHTPFPVAPVISLVTSLEETSSAPLAELVQSLIDQTYPRWELVIACPAGAVADLTASLAGPAGRDPRIRVCGATTDGGSIAHFNQACRESTGTWIAAVGPRDALTPFALHAIATAINQHVNVDLLYGDEDQWQGTPETRAEPQFKPAWSPDLLRSRNYLGHFAIVRRTHWDRLGGVRDGWAGATLYDLHLRATEQARAVVHIPQVLYHARRGPSPTAAELADDVPTVTAARRALGEHLERCGQPGTVRHAALPHCFHVSYALPRRPVVSVVIPNRDQPDVLRRCLDSLWQTDYEPLEVVIVENGSRDPRTHEYYATLARLPQVRIVRFTAPFNYAAVINQGVRASSGEVIVQLNNDTQAMHPDWLERMLEHALRPEIGAVGAKLYYPDNDRLQHAGAVIGLGGAAGHIHLGLAREASGYLGRLVTIHNCTVLTGACLMTRRNVFEEVQGMDESFPLDCNDADFCLKIRARGYRNLWTPLAELYHFESMTRGTAPTAQRQALLDEAVQRLRDKWARVFQEGDPYYNPHLSLTGGGYELRHEVPPLHSRAA